MRWGGLRMTQPRRHFAQARAVKFPPTHSCPLHTIRLRSGSAGAMSTASSGYKSNPADPSAVRESIGWHVHATDSCITSLRTVWPLFLAFGRTFSASRADRPPDRHASADAVLRDSIVAILRKQQQGKQEGRAGHDRHRPEVQESSK